MLHVAVPNIYDELSLEKIRVERECRLVPEQRSEAEIKQMIRNESTEDYDRLFDSLNSGSFSRNQANTWESEPIINLVDTLIDVAVRQNASDIHLEPDENELHVRFRKDGLLHPYKTLPGFLSESVLIRLKLLARVDITERRLPHDGSFSFQGALGKMNVRLSTLPIQCGEQTYEKCVLRLLPDKDENTTLNALGFSQPIMNALEHVFNSPQGLFLVTGPTGSGKTTTLYAGLRKILADKINVTTIEDPVEYRLRGANQVQVNEKCGFTFAVALRSILRQDPDVILVGEIRDSETAQIALRAALTGHLVLATLHTNSAKTAEARLLDLGIKKSILNECLLGVFSQRLLRKKAGGRVPALEFLLPDGTFVDGDIRADAQRLVNQGIVESSEMVRVVG